MSRFALAIGSNGPTWQKQLRFAESDAVRVAACLADECEFVVPPPQSYAHSHDVIRHISQVAAACMHGDELIVYFSGHGTLYRGRLFLLWGTTTPKIFDSAINAAHVIEALNFSSASQKLLILDCCHAGGAVGFKGDLGPVLTEGGNHLVLCASGRLELAREFEELSGSFLAAHICELLLDRRQQSITLTELVQKLRLQAAQHNSVDAVRSVPEPYLFGEQKSPFTIKKRKGPAAVEVAIRSLYQPDMSILKSTLMPFLGWNETYILNSLPVRTTVPQEFTDRTETLNRYLETDEWPCLVEQRTKDQARYAAQQLIPEFEEDITRAVRSVTASAIGIEGTFDFLGRDTVLEWYIKAKAIATLRVFQAIWHHNEPYPPWTDRFKQLRFVWGSNLIHGLTWVASEEYNWAFWTDADWIVGGRRVRIFIPQSLGIEGELDQLTVEQWRQLLIPQLVEQHDKVSYTDLRAALKDDAKALYEQVTIRGERFIDTESHNAAAISHETRATQIAARSAVEMLRKLPPDKRGGRLFLLSTSVLDDLYEQTRVLMPELG